MSSSGASNDRGAVGTCPRFVLYVEGPRDREILRIWARRISFGLARSVEPSFVILGGRQPARALEHFRDLGGSRTGACGVCVLDRDGHGDSSPEGTEPGLEFFTWPRRHIESYLLVRRAIYRCLGVSGEDWLATRLLDEHIPQSHDELALRAVDAKRLLSPTGPIAQGMGRSLRPSKIARAMQHAELHDDVLKLFGLLRLRLGVAEPERYLVAR
jgi:hypothetical protein